MFLKKIDSKLGVSLSLFLLLGLLYSLFYSPVYYLNGFKSYNTLYSQGDVYTYIDFAKKEIENHSFFEWFLKLNLNNISLVYFSWFQGVLNQIVASELILTSILIVVVYAIVGKISTFSKSDVLFSAFSLLMSFSLLIHMQTYSKEIWTLLFLIIALCGTAKKDKKLIVFGLFFLTILRFYFALIFAVSFCLFYLFKKASKKVSISMVLAFLLSFPVVYSKIFPQFLVPSNFNSSFGVSSYYLNSIQYPGLLLMWLPFRVCENLFEPFLKIYNTDFRTLIFQIPSVLDLLTSTAIALLVGFVWRLRKNLKLTSEFAKFLVIFVVVYLVVIASLPIVHFRYLVPLLPALGILVDLLKSSSSSVLDQNGS